MKIALYYPWVSLKSGVERTILETIKNSKHQYTVFTNNFDLKNTFPEFNKIDVVQLKRIPLKTNFLSTVFCALTIASQKVDLSNFDLLLINTEGIADLILLRNHEIPTAVICYTPFRPLYDNIHKSMLHKKNNILKNYLIEFVFRLFNFVDQKLWQKISHIFFISNESMRRAKEGKLITKSSSYSILNPGINWSEMNKSTKYSEYFFVPGRISWSKNIELAILGFKIFKDNYHSKKFKLIIAGQIDTKSVKYFKHLKSLSKSNNSISFIKNPSDKTMQDLYLNCLATISTAYNEDWGLTPIEGNGYSKASLFINSGGYKESQVNNKTGMAFENNPKDLASKMLIMANNRKNTIKLGKQARIHSKKYSWQKTVKMFDEKISDLFMS